MIMVGISWIKHPIEVIWKKFLIVSKRKFQKIEFVYVVNFQDFKFDEQWVGVGVVFTTGY